MRAATRACRQRALPGLCLAWLPLPLSLVPERFNRAEGCLRGFCSFGASLRGDGSPDGVSGVAVRDLSVHGSLRLRWHAADRLSKSTHALSCECLTLTVACVPDQAKSMSAGPSMVALTVRRQACGCAFCAGHVERRLPGCRKSSSCPRMDLPIAASVGSTQYATIQQAIMGHRWLEIPLACPGTSSTSPMRSRAGSRTRCASTCAMTLATSAWCAAAGLNSSDAAGASAGLIPCGLTMRPALVSPQAPHRSLHRQRKSVRARLLPVVSIDVVLLAQVVTQQRAAHDLRQQVRQRPHVVLVDAAHDVVRA